MDDHHGSDDPVQPATQGGIKTAKGKPVLDADGGEPVMVGPASFDPETWGGRIQSELAQRSQSGRQRRHSTNPLLGVAKCGGVCGRNMRHFRRTKGERHYRYYICGDSPKACPPGVLVNADDAEQTVETSFLHVHADRRIKERVWQDGSDHSAELEQTNQTIAALLEDRAMGLFNSPDAAAMYRRQVQSLEAKRDSLEQVPVVKAGWIDVETDKTYGAVWPGATPEERRKMLVDAGMKLTVNGRNEYGTYIDLDKALGEGAVGKELFEEIEARAAEERRKWGGVPN